MTRFRAAVAALVAVLACTLVALVRTPAASAANLSPLPDSTVLARVEQRLVRVYDYRERYFASDAQARPAPDSLGRIAFLSTMVDKEVLGLTAAAANRPLSPSDLRSIRQREETQLAYLAYKHRVMEPVTLSEQELRDRYAEQAWELKLRYLLLPDETTARFVHSQLIRGRMTWRDAATRYSVGPDSLREGDLGWRSRADLFGAPMSAVYKLRPPGYSEPIRDLDGFKIWQCLGRRAAQMPDFRAVRSSLLMELRGEKQGALDAQFLRELTARAKPQYDSTNIVWLAERFRIANTNLNKVSGLDLRSRVPVLDVADTSRVLARVGARTVSCGTLLTTYRDIPPVRRRRIETPAAVFSMLERMVLQPAGIDYAREHGYERDAEFVAELAKVREGIAVEHLYEDSVTTRISVTEAMRKAYFESNPNQFVSRERVVYALIPRVSEAGADSVIALLKSGMTPQAILSRDSLGGMTRGALHEAFAEQQHVYHNLLFEELRAGQSGKQFLSVDSLWVVFHVLTHDPPKTLSYADARDLVDQIVETQVAGQLFDDFLARHRKRYKIVVHNELLPRVRLVDPYAEKDAATTP